MSRVEGILTRRHKIRDFKPFSNRDDSTVFSSYFAARKLHRRQQQTVLNTFFDDMQQ